MYCRKYNCILYKISDVSDHNVQDITKRVQLNNFHYGITGISLPSIETFTVWIEHSRNITSSQCVYMDN